MSWEISNEGKRRPLETAFQRGDRKNAPGSGAAALNLPLQVVEQAQQSRLAGDRLLRRQRLERLQGRAEVAVEASLGRGLRIGVRNLDADAMTMALRRDVENGVEPVHVARALQQPRG